MTIISMIMTVLGLCLFEVICSVDNAIINAQVLGTMSPKGRRWFLVWGLFLAVFVVRGVLPWLLVWSATTHLGAWGSLMAAFSSDPSVKDAIDSASPVLMVGGGIFLVALYLHWLFLEDKEYGLIGEKFIHDKGVWFYAFVSLLLTVTVWYALKIRPVMAFGATIGMSVFFITHGFKQNAEESEKRLISGTQVMSDLSKILYLEVIDATFSIDGVIGAFAFTLSVPLILLGNGLGAIVLRQLTMGNIDRIKKYVFLKNGAMYSVGILGLVMLLDSFGVHVPHWVSPVCTFIIVGYFFWKSLQVAKRMECYENQ